MSVDMVVNRSTTRVHAPPGGLTSISFGDEFTPLPKAADAAQHTVTAPGSPQKPKDAELEQKIATMSLSSETDSSGGSTQVTVLVASGKSDTELIAAIVKALALEGMNNPTVIKVADSNLLPYTAQKVSGGGVVLCAACLPTSSSSSGGHKSASLEGALLQAGVSSGVFIVPAVIEASNLLEAKVLMAEKASGWAQACMSLMHLQRDVLPEPISYAKAVLPPPAPVITTDTLNVASLLEDLRLSLKEHGASGIFGLGRKFRIVDDNGSGSLDLSEFIKMVSEHAMRWTAAQTKAVFDFFDTDSSGTISFTEFIKGVRGKLNERRRSLVLMAFEILDKDKSGVVDASDLEGTYDASKHPDVLSHKKTQAEVLREFLDTFDSPNCKDGKVTTNEFCEYYGTLSASIDDDDYFELMIRNAWHISGGEGWCANSSCKRVLVTHTDGRQTVEEVKNDLGVGETDAPAMLARLISQGINDIVSIETAGGIRAFTAAGSAAAAAAAAAGAAAVGTAANTTTAAAAAASGDNLPAAGTARRVETSSFDTVRPSTAPPALQARANKQRLGAGESSIVFG